MMSMHNPPYFLGVDGGGTKTLAVVVDAQGRECGRGLTGSANQSAVGLHLAVSHLHAAIAEATRIAGCQVPLRAAWFGVAGIDSPHDHAALFPHLSSLAEVVHLTNDAELILSALDDAVGVALIAGTGSIALGRDAHGTTARAGGWGHILGDEGSGYDIGRQGLQAAVRAADGRGEPTMLLARIMHYWQLSVPSDIMARVYPDEDKSIIAQLAAIVLSAAREGDQLAHNIVEQAAKELALAVVATSATLDFPERRVPLALGGGLLLHEPIFCTQVLHHIRRHHPIGQLVLVEEPALSAARAAIHLARGA